VIPKENGKKTCPEGCNGLPEAAVAICVDRMITPDL
jgi:hypothetical protein